ncbi:acyl transferase [Parapedobacter indicus]|uniref:Acyl-protein synthetase, LuxE n=1 Tax=Parapedobacter indicus TaxID=1477437 RepID=A0A1I3SUB0_9SPHI|nr:acyl transferase [Parapedobacter indicus]PPK99709.1 hypothetical protein CLV26_11140 [Parapedobacter indicus]SFJ61439.1 hypothetical protein SAMN05444682_111159 [Parapedobacter indicus]
MLSADHIFSIASPQEFDDSCLEIFRYQSRHCAVYAKYLALLGVNTDLIKQPEDIPFLPIEFFKKHTILSVNREPQVVFSSSGTTGSVQSKHFVADVAIYEKSFRTAFTRCYGSAEDWTILALLPAYAEREGSSLIYMVNDLIHQSKDPLSGYFLYDHAALFDALEQLKAKGSKTLLIGVTYALLDFVEKYRMDFPGLLVMETGGMKGRRREMVREEVHELLCAGFNVASIHSEYGMTELLSQAYSTGNGLFCGPPWMKIVVRDTNDPFCTLPEGLTGGINVIDLANMQSCAFIATQDLGKTHSEGHFEVLGRFDQSDIRGCNLLIQ